MPNIESVVRIDPATNTVAQRVNAGGQVAPIRLDGGALCYGSWHSDFLGRVDTATGSVTGLTKLPGQPFGIATGFGSLWVADRDDESLFVVRPAG